MSGLLGICRWDGGLVTPETLNILGKFLRYGGSHEPAYWRAPSIGLGHCSLTSPSKTAPLPHWWQEARLCITADARIDNREALYDSLDLSSRGTDEVADGELILRAYRKWGEECPGKLLGDFAFAIWDERRQVLFCARDPFGVKPFFYHSDGRAFSFASDFGALLALPGVPRTVNRQRIAAFLTHMEADDESTFFQNVSRLEPAHTLSVQHGNVASRRYYHVPLGTELQFADEEEYAAAFHEIFVRSVRRRTRGMERVSCLLSGGLDSSSITCVAARLTREKGGGPIHTFSNIYRDVPECDESPYIQSVLDQGGCQPHRRLVEARRSPADLEALMAMLGEPTRALGLFGGNGGIYPLMRNAGCSAVLDGHGGDEVLAEVNAIVVQLAEQNRWVELALEYRPLMKAYDMPFLRNYLRLVFSRGLSVRLREKLKLRTRLRRFAGRPDAPPPTATPDWAVRLNPQFTVEMELATKRKSWRKTQPAAISDARFAHLHRLTHTGQSVAFEQIGRLAVRGGVEPSYPFWDREMVEFCLRLPARFKLRRGLTRTVLRDSLKGILPDKIRRRRDKTDFAPQVVASLKSMDENWMHGLLEGQPIGAELLSSTWYHRIVSRLFAGERHLGEDLPHLCNSLSLLIWLRQYASP